MCLSVPNFITFYFYFLLLKLCIIHCHHILIYITIYHIQKFCLSIKSAVYTVVSLMNQLKFESMLTNKYTEFIIYRNKCRSCFRVALHVMFFTYQCYHLDPFLSARFKWCFVTWEMMEYMEALALYFRRGLKIELCF